MSKESVTPQLHRRMRGPAQPSVTHPRSASAAINILASVSRALAHGLRGDLAVVASDLTYLTTQIPDLDLNRPQRRIAHMVKLLAQLDPLRSGFHPRSILLSELLTCFPGATHPPRTTRTDAALALPEELTVPGDYTWVRWMAQAVAALLAAEPATWKVKFSLSGRAARPTVGAPRQQRNSRILELHLSTTHSPRTEESTDTAAPTTWSYNTAEQYAERMHGESHVVAGGLIDLTLLGHAWWCQFRGNVRRSEVIIYCPLGLGAA